MDDVIETLLHQGLVIDAYRRASLAGLEVSTVDGRTIVTTLDTYLRKTQAGAGHRRVRGRPASR